MGIKRVAPIVRAVTGSVSAWATCSEYYVNGGSTEDLSTIIPSNATGLLLTVRNVLGNYFVGIRPVGSSSGINQWLPAGAFQMMFVKLDENQDFQYYKQNASTEFWIEAYTTDNWVFFDNPTDKTPSPNVWADIDVSVLCPDAIGILFEVYRVDGWFWGVRNKGSTQDLRSAVSHHSWGIIGCNESQVFQFFNDDFGGANALLFVWGYITGDASFQVNLPDITGGVGSWDDKDLSGYGGEQIALLHTYGATFSYGAREDGESESRAGGTEGIYFLFTNISEAGVIEVYRSVNAGKFLYYVGHLSEGVVLSRNRGYVLA